MFCTYFFVDHKDNAKKAGLSGATGMNGLRIKCNFSKLVEEKLCKYIKINLYFELTPGERLTLLYKLWIHLISLDDLYQALMIIKWEQDFI